MLSIGLLLLATASAGVVPEPECRGADLSPGVDSSYTNHISVTSGLVYSENSHLTPLRQGKLRTALFYAVSTGSFDLAIFRPVYGAGIQTLVHWVRINVETPNWNSVSLDLDVQQNDRLGFVYAGDGVVPLGYADIDGSYTSVKRSPQHLPRIGDEVRFGTGHTERFGLAVCYTDLQPSLGTEVSLAADQPVLGPLPTMPHVADGTASVEALPTTTVTQPQTFAATTASPPQTFATTTATQPQAMPTLGGDQRPEDCHGADLSSPQLFLRQWQTLRGLIYSDNSLYTPLRAGTVRAVQLYALSAGTVQLAVLRPVIGAGLQTLVSSVTLNIPRAGLQSVALNLLVSDNDRLGLLFSGPGPVPVAYRNVPGAYTSLFRDPQQLPSVGQEVALSTGHTDKLALRFCYGPVTAEETTAATSATSSITTPSTEPTTPSTTATTASATVISTISTAASLTDSVTSLKTSGVTSSAASLYDPQLCRGAELSAQRLPRYNQQYEHEGGFVYSDNSAESPLTAGRLRGALLVGLGDGQIELAVFRPLEGAARQSLVYKQRVQVRAGLMYVPMDVQVLQNDRIGLIVRSQGTAPVLYRKQPGSYTSFYHPAQNFPETFGDEVSFRAGHIDHFALAFCYEDR